MQPQARPRFLRQSLGKPDVIRVIVRQQDLFDVADLHTKLMQPIGQRCISLWRIPSRSGRS
jgi:hypothetical protein